MKIFNEILINFEVSPFDQLNLLLWRREKVTAISTLRVELVSGKRI